MGMARAYWDYQTSARLHHNTPFLSSPLFLPLIGIQRAGHIQPFYSTAAAKTNATCLFPLLLPSVVFLHLHRGPHPPCSALVGLAGLAGLVLVCCVKFDAEHHKSGLLHLQGALNRAANRPLLRPLLRPRGAHAGPPARARGRHRASAAKCRSELGPSISGPPERAAETWRPHQPLRLRGSSPLSDALQCHETRLLIIQ
ncbi:hypothetical protein V8C34DRAFT_227915 [Trichoderma compactum]